MNMELKRLMINYCEQFDQRVYLANYTPGDPSTALAENFSCPYAASPNSIDVCCEKQDLDDCPVFWNIFDEISKMPKEGQVPLKT